jgi:hypothetical protein
MYKLMRKVGLDLKKDSNLALIWVVVGLTLGLGGQAILAIITSLNIDTAEGFVRDDLRPISTAFIILGNLMAPLQIVNVWIKIGIQASAGSNNKKNQMRKLKTFIRVYQFVMAFGWVVSFIIRNTWLMRIVAVGGILGASVVFHLGGKHIVEMLHPGDQKSTENDADYHRSVEPSIMINECCKSVRNAMLALTFLQIASSPTVTKDDEDWSAFGMVLFLGSMTCATYMNWVILQYCRYGSRKALGISYRGFRGGLGLISTKISSTESSGGKSAGEKAVNAIFGGRKISSEKPSSDIKSSSVASVNEKAETTAEVETV